MEIPFTLVTTGVLALIFFTHSLRTINARRDTKTNLGDGGNDIMLRRIRTHGNFAEYVPFLMFILFLLETQGVPVLFLGAFALAVVLGRLLHAYGLYSPATPGVARVLGMQLTLWPLILGGMYLIYLGLF
ncbi:MAG: hypothetical protein RLZZ360_924 [Candidatus Parcubacteria bacterium]|jgi:uncharacterized membrane protein YecN with MAPEG domain